MVDMIFSVKTLEDEMIQYHSQEVTFSKTF